MNWIADLLIVLILVLCTLIGKKRGFIKTFFGFFGSLIAFVVSSVLSKPVGTFLAEKCFSPVMNRVLLEALREKIGSVETVDFSVLPESAAEILEKFGTNADSINSFLAAQSELAGQQLQDAVLDFIVRPVSIAAGVSVAFIVLFLVLAVGIRILVRALDLISKLPILNFSNRFLGAGIGFVWGVLLAVIVSAILTVAAPAMQNTALFAAFHPDETILVKLFSKLDFILSAITGKA